MSIRYVLREMFADQLFSIEGVKEFIVRVKSRSASRFLKYADWLEEVNATGKFLENIKEDRKVKGIDYQQDAELILKGIEALTKVLVEIQKKTPVDFGKSTLLNGLKSIGVITTADTIVLTDYNLGEWKRKVDGYKTLKDLGWTKSKAVDYAKKLSAALKNVGEQNKYESWIVGVINTYTSNMKDKVQYDKLSKVTKQAQLVFEIRHQLILDARLLFVSLKKIV
jgi:hypothetical protein